MTRVSLPAAAWEISGKGQHRQQPTCAGTEVVSLLYVFQTRSLRPVSGMPPAL